MTEDKKYLKRQLNQACNSVGCLYQFFIDNLMPNEYRLIHSLKAYGGKSYAAFHHPAMRTYITECNNSFKIDMGLFGGDLIIRAKTYKLIGKYK